jgi:FecR protein
MSMRGLAAPLILAVFSCCVALPALADSQARIVRLSQVDGDVQIDRNLGQGYEKAFLNLPVTQGVKIRTGQDARAEIEFEDGSTLRITPGSVLEFPELALRDSGNRASSLELQQGTAYLNFKGEKGGEFSLAFGRESLRLSKPAHLRVEMRDASATVAVFSGVAEVGGSADPVEVDKKHSVTYDLAGTTPYTVANNLEPDPYDEWDKQQDRYHQQYSANSYSPYSYGASDLNYYGSFYNMPGYGMMWQPYLVGAGWDPFMNGAWMWYPGSGYAWVSSYPWGWTPYRYGSWNYISGQGWFWRPGTTWTGWNTGVRIATPPERFSPPRPPSTPGQTLIVSRGMPAVGAGVVQGGSEIRSGSAGLGVPRGSVHNLGRVSQQIAGPTFGNGTVHAGSAVRLPAGGYRSAASPRGAAPSAGASPHVGGGSVSSGSSSHGATHK